MSNEEEHKDTQLRVLKLPEPEPLTFTQIVWSLAQALFILLVVCAIGATVGEACWDALTVVTGLPEVTWSQAFAGALLLRMVGAMLGTSDKGIV